MRPLNRERAGKLALACAALWWATTLLWGVSIRAFDRSDPGQQLEAAARSSAVLRAAGPRAWAGAVAAGSLAKPAQNAALSLAFSAGLPATPVGYQLVTGFFVLAALLLLQWCVLALFGVEASIAFAVFCASSSAVLAEAYHGGHTWFGQGFLWSALALELHRAQGQSRSKKTEPKALITSLGLGLLCGLAVLSSHHMAPLAAALCLRRLWTSRARVFFGLLLGAFGPLVLLELLATGEGRPHYWDVLGRMLTLATQAKVPELSSIHGFVLRWLFGAEGFFFGLVALVAAAFAARERPKLVGGVLAGLALYELPWALRIGRVQLPLLLALFAAAASCAARLEKRALAGACAMILAAALPRLADTRAAFHFRGPMTTLGVSLPFDYGEKARGARCAGLSALAPETPVLVSYWSGWFWRGFLPKERFDVPVAALYASSAPHREVPGVESTPQHLFSNDALYYRVKRGELPFPKPNRVYKAADVAAACRAAGIL